MDTELFKEWFQAFAQQGGLTLHIWNHYGENNHTSSRAASRAWRRRCASLARSIRGKRRAVPQHQGVL